jgi:hypothetical protein
MKVLLLAFCAVACLPLYAGRRRAAVPPEGLLAIEFVDVAAADTTLIAAGSDALVELNTVSQRAGSMGTSVRMRRQFGIRIVRSGLSWGTAIVTARLNSPDGRASVRIDGKPLAGLPVVIDSRAAVGAMAVHTLEIEVPGSAAPGPLAASISLEVETQ